jgi:hypothetical protein
MELEHEYLCLTYYNKPQEAALIIQGGFFVYRKPIRLELCKALVL